MAMVLNLLKIGVVLVVLFVFLGLFMDNAAAWGDAVGQLFTAIKTFITSLINALPIG